MGDCLGTFTVGVNEIRFLCQVHSFTNCIVNACPLLFFNFLFILNAQEQAKTYDTIEQKKTPIIKDYNECL